MGRFLGFLADALALARASIELAEVARRFGRQSDRPRVDGGKPDAAPAPVRLPAVDQSARPPLGESEVQGPAAGLTDPA